MRRFTLVTLICLFLLIAGAAVYQLALANRDVERFPGPRDRHAAAVRDGRALIAGSPPMKRQAPPACSR